MLSEPTQRDVYNYFGEEGLKSDPRIDEIQLIIQISLSYMTWAAVVLFSTFPHACRACRPWALVSLVLMITTEISLCVSHGSIPSWLPFNITEHELVEWMHALFPSLFLVLRAISVTYYLNTDAISLLLSLNIQNHQTVSGYIPEYVSNFHDE